MSRERIACALDAEEATEALLSRLQEGDAVLVKGSHFMGLERLVSALKEKGTI
jgi:UDP-N-acetylmuramyl pentapeptide synthase